jgi:F-box and WD-40 domain protein 1/11
MSRRTSVLTHRPKTSSAVDDAPPKPFDLDMKRTASQTFTFNNSTLDATTVTLPLGPVHEDMRAEYPASLSQQSQHSQSSSLSRASQVLAGSYKQICRRLSSSSSRRPSLQSMIDGAPGYAIDKNACRIDYPRLHLQHQDSGIPTPQAEGPPAPHSKFSIKQRFGSIRHRRPAASGPSGDFARYNPVPAPIPSNYPPPGHAARQAAAAANNDRMTQQRKDQEQTQQFLAGHLTSPRDEVIKDSESGVGMTCSSPITRTDSVQEKKMGMPAP